jgi:hypothetical protein
MLVVGAMEDVGVVWISISVPLFFSLSFAFTVIFTSIVPASSPKWVKTTAEGGGLFLIVFVCYMLPFYFASMYFVHIAFSDHGR